MVKLCLKNSTKHTAWLMLSKQQKGMISKIEGTDTEFDGTYLKFTDEFKKAVEEKGIDAFKLGGPVEIDRMLAEL